MLINRSRVVRASLALSLFAAAAAAADRQELLLRRYVPIEVYVAYNPGVEAMRADCRYTYMDVEDTYIAADRPDANFGRSERLIIADPEHDKILIAFRQLYRAIPPDMQIKNVELLLVPDGEIDRDAVIELRRVLLPWRDGASDGEYPACATTYRDRFTGDGDFRRPWTTAGGDADCAAEPSFTGSLASLWDADRQAFVISGPGLAADVTEWLGRYYRNYGWMISVKSGHKPTAPLKFFASDVLEEAHRPALRIVYDHPAKRVLKPRHLPDLDVTYIERTPRFMRYNDNGRTTYFRRDFHGDRPGVMIDPDYDEYQKHPREGDLVVFVAHVKNASDEPYHGPLSYRWTVNDRVVLECTADSPTAVVDLAPWQEFTTRLEWEWHVDSADHRRVVVEFEADTDRTVDELSENNNAVRKYVAAKTLKFWVERSAYEYVKDYITCWGSLSYEDYLQWHMDVWNETYFDKSRFDDCAPDGMVIRTTLDDFEIVPDGLLGGGIHRPEDRLDPRFDGEWGTEWAPFDTDREDALRDYYNFLQSHRVTLEPSLLHELSHQVWGAYDIYWSNIEPSTPTEPVGKCKVKDETGNYITRGSWYVYAGLMGGDDTRPNPSYWESTGLYSAVSAIGANGNARFRNGFYGEWQYDLPRDCYVRLTSPDGVPLTGATITLWQQTWAGITNENLVAENVPVGADGIVRLPDQDSLDDADVTTFTGHTLRKHNPWGRIDVVGQNITLLMQVNAFGQRDYRFVRVLPYNKAYRAGHTESYTLPMPCRICPSNEIDFGVNVARDARVITTRTADQAGNLVDGDVTTSWHGGAAAAGDSIEIELAQPMRVGVVQLVQNEGFGQFFRRFAIKTRGAEGSAWRAFDQQVPWPFGDAINNEKDVNPDRPSERWVTYAHAPELTKVIRIEALDGGHAQLSEIRVFAERQP